MSSNLCTFLTFASNSSFKEVEVPFLAVVILSPLLNFSALVNLASKIFFVWANDYEIVVSPVTTSGLKDVPVV